uniref:Uncharacterized protein n=1 Tax=Lotharella oceanica TaxID=641309 RepID=A0A7S2TEC5_9EUKA|mmetsp:Transcript_10190/g.19585  ORF Transcript_10190/g.19585 Transcript_10190/m.19585 type:complete len:424 (+) Transcript_10190:128-1399(+)
MIAQRKNVPTKRNWRGTEEQADEERPFKRAATKWETKGLTERAVPRRASETTESKEESGTTASAPSREESKDRKPKDVTCPFCEKVIEVDDPKNLHTKLESHCRKHCPKVKENPDWVKQSMSGACPQQPDARRPMSGLNLEVFVPKHRLPQFRASSYKLEEANSELPPTAFKSKPLNQVGVVAAEYALRFPGGHGLLVDHEGTERKMNEDLEALKSKDHHLLEAAGTREGSTHANIRLLVDVNDIEAHVTAGPLTSGALTSAEQSLLQEASNRTPMEANRVRCGIRKILDLKLKEKLGAIDDGAFRSVRVLTNAEYYVPYQIVVPLASTAKVVHIIDKIWNPGGSTITAHPTAAESRRANPIKVAVARAWITHPNFSEEGLMRGGSGIAKMISWIGNTVTGNTGTAPSIGGLICEYWACDVTN